VGGAADDLKPLALGSLSADARFIGVRLSGVAAPEGRAAEGTARLRVGARGGTTLIAYAEGRTERASPVAPSEAGGDLVPTFHDLGALDREGLSTGADLTVALASVLWVGGGADYRHACGCVALAAFGGRRQGRGGFDAGLSLDLMP
jgi:hypothetical protein